MSLRPLLTKKDKPLEQTTVNLFHLCHRSQHLCQGQPGLPQSSSKPTPFKDLILFSLILHSFQLLNFIPGFTNASLWNLRTSKVTSFTLRMADKSSKSHIFLHEHHKCGLHLSTPWSKIAYFAIFKGRCGYFRQKINLHISFTLYFMPVI